MIISTILGLVVERDTDVAVYNYSQHKAYTLSKEQFSKVDVGNFPFFLFASPRYADNDVIGYGLDVCMVKNRKLINIATGERVAVKPTWTDIGRATHRELRPFRKFCFLIKHCVSYEDALHGRIDQRTQVALDYADRKTTEAGLTLTDYNVATYLWTMAEEPQGRTFFNNDWFRAYEAVGGYWNDRGECPVLSLDILRR